MFSFLERALNKMKKLGKILRLIGLVLLIILASMGMGLPFSFLNRERYQDKKIQIELVDKKEDDGDEEN